MTTTPAPSPARGTAGTRAGRESATATATATAARGSAAGTPMRASRPSHPHGSVCARSPISRGRAHGGGGVGGLDEFGRGRPQQIGRSVALSRRAATTLDVRSSGFDVTLASRARSSIVTGGVGRAAGRPASAPAAQNPVRTGLFRSWVDGREPVSGAKGQGATVVATTASATMNRRARRGFPRRRSGYDQAFGDCAARRPGEAGVDQAPATTDPRPNLRAHRPTADVAVNSDRMTSRRVLPAPLRRPNAGRQQRHWR